MSVVCDKSYTTQVLEDPVSKQYRKHYFNEIDPADYFILNPDRVPQMDEVERFIFIRVIQYFCYRNTCNKVKVDNITSMTIKNKLQHLDRKLVNKVLNRMIDLELLIENEQERLYINPSLFDELQSFLVDPRTFSTPSTLSTSSTLSTLSTLSNLPSRVPPGDNSVVLKKEKTNKDNHLTTIKTLKNPPPGDGRPHTDLAEVLRKYGLNK